MDEAVTDGRGARIVARFEVRARAYLDAAGEPLGPLPALAEDRDAMVALYRAMVRTRVFEARTVAMQRTGQLGTSASSLGQEAVSVGAAAAMAGDDVLFTTYREVGGLLWRKVSMVEMLLYWAGDERGCDYADQPHDFPICITMAAQALHAAGVATAFKLKREARVAVCILGDGATSKGDFYEAINLAGVWRLPVVFVVNNNQWAISLPRAKQTAAATLAQKAIAAGFDGEQIDGNDIIAVRQVVGELVARARAGGGPGLVEAVTYRLHDHTTADDAGRYRSDGEVSAAWKREPVARARAYLAARAWWAQADEEALHRACRAEVEAARDAFLALPPDPPTAMFDHLYATLPPALAGQRAAMAALAEAGGDG